MTSLKLTREQIMAIPGKLKVQSRTEIAQEYNVNKETISRWVKKLRERGMEISIPRGRKPILDTNDTNNVQTETSL